MYVYILYTYIYIFHNSKAIQTNEEISLPDYHLDFVMIPAKI